MKNTTISITTTFTCDCDGSTSVQVSGSALPSGWKKSMVPPNDAQRVMGAKSKEKDICPECLASDDPEMLAKIKTLLLP